jgi:hypothetical protein
MKTLVAAVALAIAAAISLPVSAQTRKTPEHRIVVNTPDGQRHSGNPAWDVYVAGSYVGSDPDPFIRHVLRIEAIHPWRK